MNTLPGKSSEDNDKDIFPVLATSRAYYATVWRVLA